MGRQPVRRQESRSRQHSKLQRAPNSAQTPGTRQLLSRLIRVFQRYPLLLVLTVWVVFLLLASLAFTTMMSLDYSKRSVSLTPLASAPIPAPSAAAPVPSPIESARHSDGLPLLSLMAIALICAIGCIILLRCLQPRLPIKRLQLANSRLAAASISGQTSPEAFRAEGTAEVSLVPPEINQPLDWEEPSLADSLDLRQRRPLSHWL